MMYWWGNGMGGWGMVLMILSSLLFWALVVIGIVVLARYVGRGGQPAVPGDQHPTPEQILAERFACGDINEDEYTRRLQVLGGAVSTNRPGG